MHDLDETIRERRSVQGFLSDRPVPRHVICEALELAQRAPSNCNVQPGERSSRRELAVIDCAAH